MFILTEFKDVVKIAPSKFKWNLNDAVADEINRKLANKVFMNIGLCIALHDITAIKDSHIFPNDGSSHTLVNFRFIVFRPFVEEIIIGKIRSCSSEGVHVTLGFFEDILIPPNKLQEGTRFDAMEQVWIWEYTDPESENKTELFLDVDDLIRFRVIKEEFVEELPSRPSIAGDRAEITDAKSIAPYSIIGGIDEPGLGVMSWWG